MAYPSDRSNTKIPRKGLLSFWLGVTYFTYLFPLYLSLYPIQTLSPLTFFTSYCPSFGLIFSQTILSEPNFDGFIYLPSSSLCPAYQRWENHILHPSPGVSGAKLGVILDPSFPSLSTSNSQDICIGPISILIPTFVATSSTCCIIAHK